MNQTNATNTFTNQTLCNANCTTLPDVNLLDHYTCNPSTGKCDLTRDTSANPDFGSCSTNCLSKYCEGKIPHCNDCDVTTRVDHSTCKSCDSPFTLNADKTGCVDPTPPPPPAGDGAFKVTWDKSGQCTSCVAQACTLGKDCLAEKNGYNCSDQCAEGSDCSACGYKGAGVYTITWDKDTCTSCTKEACTVGPTCLPAGHGWSCSAKCGADDDCSACES